MKEETIGRTVKLTEREWNWVQMETHCWVKNLEQQALWLGEMIEQMCDEQEYGDAVMLESDRARVRVDLRMAQAVREALEEAQE